MEYDEYEHIDSMFYGIQCSKYEHVIYEYPLFSENRVRREAVNHGVSDVLMWHSLAATLESTNLKWCRPMDQMKQ